MRTFGRTLGAFALVAVLLLVPAGVASAKKKSKVDAFAAKYHLDGTWRAKDIDRDGLKNFKEFKLGTNPRKADTDGDKLKDADEVTSGNNPRKADTDGDKVKDGAEHAGVVTSFDGETVKIRQFNGPNITATLDTSCDAAGDSSLDDEDPTADDSSIDDDGFADVTDDSGAFAAQAGDDEDDVDLGEDDVDLDDDVAADSSSCDDSDLKKGAVLQSAEFDRDGGDYFLTSFELA